MLPYFSATSMGQSDARDAQKFAFLKQPTPTLNKGVGVAFSFLIDLPIFIMATRFGENKLPKGYLTDVPDGQPHANSEFLPP